MQLETTVWSVKFKCCARSASALICIDSRRAIALDLASGQLRAATQQPGGRELFSCSRQRACCGGFPLPGTHRCGLMILLLPHFRCMLSRWTTPTASSCLQSTSLAAKCTLSLNSLLVESCSTGECKQQQGPACGGSHGSSVCCVVPQCWHPHVASEAC
jgi:hypothetical protein